MQFLPDQDDVLSILLTLRLAFYTTVILLLFCLPLGWWMTKKKTFFRSILEVLFCLPAILPPSVLGFYLLISMGSQGPFGRFISVMGLDTLACTFSGLVIGSVIYSLPFVIQPLMNSFESLNKNNLSAAALLGAGPLDRFFSVALPGIKNGIVTATFLGFAHTLSEFGVLLMIGGNIPGSTRVMSVAIFNHVESMEFRKAHHLSLILLLFSFVTLVIVSLVNKGQLRWKIR